MAISFFTLIILIQIVVITIIVFILKKILEQQLIDMVIRQYEFGQFEQLKPSIHQVEVISYKPLNQNNKKRIIDATVKHFGGSMKLIFEIDKRILGGMVIQVASKVFNGSLRDRLRQAFR